VQKPVSSGGLAGKQAVGNRQAAAFLFNLTACGCSGSIVLATDVKASPPPPLFCDNEARNHQQQHLWVKQARGSEWLATRYKSSLHFKFFACYTSLSHVTMMCSIFCHLLARCLTRLIVLV
jgi:predicted small lipoprotein YifL